MCNKLILYSVCADLGVTFDEEGKNNKYFLYTITF